MLKFLKYFSSLLLFILVLVFLYHQYSLNKEKKLLTSSIGQRVEVDGKKYMPIYNFDLFMSGHAADDAELVRLSREAFTKRYPNAKILYAVVLYYFSYHWFTLTVYFTLL